MTIERFPETSNHCITAPLPTMLDNQYYDIFLKIGIGQIASLRFSPKKAVTCSRKTSHLSVQRIAIFASGTGSNAQKIVAYFKDHPSIEVSLVVSNKATAPVLDMAAAHGIPTLLLNRVSFYETEELLEQLKGIDLIVLAGFLWLIPDYLVRHFPRRIINIHPALLPKYGGKGMYGKYVHQAVKAAGEKESGITIHYVNEHYDEGRVIFQASCPLEAEDDAAAIAQKVLALEHRHFAPVIEQLLTINYRS